ncbi:MAG: hypothetical protein RBS80_12660 [Thermoguttaceae bacterium]|jgi:chromosome segregation ATPase|nr:hypothetical protein [Thermoguttaceae bacterium]
MDAPHLSTPVSADPIDQFDAALRHERDGVQEFLAARQRQLDEAEIQLIGYFDQLAREAACGRYASETARQDVDQQAARFARETEYLAQLRADLEAHRAEWKHIAEATTRHQEALLETLREERNALEKQRASLEQNQAELERQQAEDTQCDQAEQELLQQQIKEARSQQKRLETELAAVQSECHALKQEAATAETAAGELDALRRERDALQSECHVLKQKAATAETAAGELDALRHERDALQTECHALKQKAATAETAAGELDALRHERDALQTECHVLKQKAATAETAAGELDALRHERDALAAAQRDTEARLEQVQQELAEAKGREAASVEALAQGQVQAATDADLRRRYELAMDDLRELKQENAQLQERLKEASDAGRTARQTPASGGPLNWEAEKQRILAALESEVEGETETGRQERVDIERMVRRTERIVADKDAEIAELKQLLDNQSTSVGSLAVGAAALGDMLDKDAIIQEERKNLTELQEEWRQKLRQAEVEMSVERAKLARQRIEVEEKLRLLEERAAAVGNTPGGTAATEKPPRNRWLTRLGLKDTENGAS